MTHFIQNFLPPFSDEDAEHGPCATFLSSLFSMGYWTMGGIVAASVVAVAVIVACLIYCLCHDRQGGKYSCCGHSATPTSGGEKAAAVTAAKNKGKITVDYTALYDKKNKGRGVHPKDANAKDAAVKEDPVKTAAKKSGWYDSVMWYTMKNKKLRKPSMIDALYNEEMSQTSSSHQSSSTATSTSTDKTEEGDFKKHGGGGGGGGGKPSERRNAAASGAAAKTVSANGGGAKRGGGGAAPSEISVSTVESERVGKKKKHVSRGPWGEAVEPKKHNDPKKLKGAKKAKKMEKY